MYRRLFKLVVLTGLIVFGLPIATPATAFAASPIADGATTQGWLGVVLDDPDSDDGVAIDTVLRRSPADAADIDDDDRILSVNERSVRTPGKLESILSRQSVGQTVRLVIEQNGEHRSVDVQLLPTPSTSEVLKMHHEGSRAPEMTLTDLDDESVDFPGVDDGPLVVEFWATWCDVCRQVSRKLEEATDENGVDLDVLSITGEDRSTVRQHLETHPKQHDIALDEDERAHDEFLVESYPFVAVVDSDGTIETVATRIQDIEALIDTLVADSSSETSPNDSAESPEPSD